MIGAVCVNIIAALLLGFFGLSIKANASETTQVLPKGIFRARVVVVSTNDIDQKYNEDSELQSFSASLNRSVTIKDYVNKDPRLLQLVQALETLQPGSSENLLNSNIYSGVTTRVQTYLPALEYGVTQDLSVGIRAPIIRRIVSSNFTVDTTNNGSYYNIMAGGISPTLTNGIYSLQTQQLDSAYFKKLIFTQQGYSPEGFDKTELGDMEFGAKYEFYRSKRLDLSTLLGGRAPTGSVASLTNPYDKGSGDGSWAMGLQFFQELRAASFVSFGGMEKILYNFPDQRDRAVPNGPNDPLPSLMPQNGQVQGVTREQSPEFDGELSTTFNFYHQAFSAWTAYQFMNRGPATFYGPGNLYYDGLSNGTEVLSQNGEIGAGYSTIPAFRAKRFSVPMEVQLLYNTTLTGRNVPLASYARLDLIVYF